LYGKGDAGGSRKLQKKKEKDDADIYQWNKEVTAANPGMHRRDCSRI
jgi:hypothetical protein